jgi:hypothetical protein
MTNDALRQLIAFAREKATDEEIPVLDVIERRCFGGDTEIAALRVSWVSWQDVLMMEAIAGR